MKSKRNRFLFGFMTILLVIAVAPVSAWAAGFDSSFGFSMQVPEHWLVVNGEAVKDDSELLGTLRSDVFKGTDEAVIRQLEETIRNGDVEFLFNTKTYNGQFYDNINVTGNIRPVPQIGDGKEFCPNMKAALSRAFGKELRLYECGQTRVNGQTALLLDFDGVVDGTRTVQYQVQLLSGMSAVLTLTAKEDTLDTLRKEFDNMISSLKVQ